MSNKNAQTCLWAFNLNIVLEGKFKHSANIGKELTAGYQFRTFQKYLLYTSYVREGVGEGEAVGEGEGMGEGVGE